MAYATPTVELTAVAPDGSATIKANQPFVIKALVTSTGTVGTKMKRGRISRVSGIGINLGSFEIDGVPKYAGVNKPSTADYAANAGSDATTLFKFNALCATTGTVTVHAEIVYSRDDTGAEEQIVATDLEITVA